MALLESKKLKTIGITGSYGKTSTKNILNTVLSSNYEVLATPKSYNTPMGISNCINNEKVYLYDYFIAASLLTYSGKADHLFPDILDSLRVPEHHIPCADSGLPEG